MVCGVVSTIFPVESVTSENTEIGVPGTNVYWVLIKEANVSSGISAAGPVGPVEPFIYAQH